jgi:hypothetical protein
VEERNLRNSSGGNVGRNPSSANFLAWWDADPVRELLNGAQIDKYGTGGDTRLLTGSGVASSNGTKSTPVLSGDLFGDWREEVIWRHSGNNALRIYATSTPTTTKLHTLAHDAQYRTALAWQNTAYNQPPHPSYFLGAGMTRLRSLTSTCADGTPPAHGKEQHLEAGRGQPPAGLETPGPTTSAVLLGPDEYEGHRGRFVAAVAPSVPGAVLDHDVPGREPCAVAVVEFEDDVAPQHDSVVHGRRGVHAVRFHEVRDAG